MAAPSSFHGYSPELVKKVQDIIDTAHGGEVAPLTAYEDVSDILVEEGIAENDVLVMMEEVLVHPKNRSEMGLNGFQTHKNGNDVLVVGFHDHEVKKAAVFQLSPFEPMRSDQLRFNDLQVERSNGMLAPRFGKETCMSVSCGHLFAFFRAAKNGKCKTNITALQNASGCLSAEYIRKKDRRAGKFMDSGGRVRRFAWQCDVAWPGLADLCQRALNASLEVHGSSSELEVMCSVASFDDNRMEGQTIEDVVKTVALSKPPCLQYLTRVSDLAVVCGGGPGVPMVKFMDRFGKRFSEMKVLGEEFVSSLVDLKIGLDKCVGLKVGLILANTISTKVVDGIAKSVVKADVERLKGIGWDS